MNGLRAGTGTVDITPPVGVELAGYGVYLGRASTGIMDPLRCRALVLRNEMEAVAIACCDLIGISRDQAERARSAIARRTGIPGSNVLIACSHTHSGPATVWLRGWGEMDGDFVQVLPKYIAGAVIMASENLRPAKLAAGAGRISGLNHNRVDETQPVDEEVGVIQVAGDDGPPIALLFNFSCHAVVNPADNTLISADFPCRAAAAIDRELPGCQAMFLQGQCGDVNPVKAHTGRITEVGEALAGEVLRVSAGLEGYAANIGCASRTAWLPIDVPEEGKLERMIAENEAILTRSQQNGDPAARSWARFRFGHAQKMLAVLRRGALPKLGTETMAMRLGEGLLACHSGELFSCFGMDIKRRAPSAPTLVCGYCNDFVGYIPDEADYDRDGYAARTVPQILDNFPFRRDVGAALTDQITALTHEMARGRSDQ
jgi:neutral ceramidase